MSPLDEIYLEHSNKIYQLAYRMTGNSDEAKDITQETFVQVFKSIDKFKGESSLFTWIYKIARNNCLRFLEKKKKSNFSGLQELIGKSSGPIQEEISEQEKSRYIFQVKEGCLSGVLRCLSLHQRMVFILNVLLDVPLSDIAPIVKKSENATRILLHRSRQNIKNFLCENCSLYNQWNKCKCENLVDFSLKSGWILPDSEFTKNNKQLEYEIKTIKNEVLLFKSLENKGLPQDISLHLKQLLSEKHDFLTFSNKKVK